tara:strand:- start:348 stop:593 length:246 start_codon:yes stop_codon:yes gene_type:complete
MDNRYAVIRNNAPHPKVSWLSLFPISVSIDGFPVAKDYPASPPCQQHHAAEAHSYPKRKPQNEWTSVSSGPIPRNGDSVEE